MSFLVELPLELYNPHAFAAFKPVAPYDLGTARALMWLSQLAYETAHPDKIARICQLWGLAQPRTIASVPGALPLTRTRAIVVEGHGAMLMAFAGTDPLVPPSSLGFRHVGRLLTCARAGAFAKDAQPTADLTDDPPFVRSLVSGLQQGVLDLFAGRLQPSFRDDDLGRLSGLLPPPIAD